MSTNDSNTGNMASSKKKHFIPLGTKITHQTNPKRTSKTNHPTNQKTTPK